MNVASMFHPLFRFASKLVNMTLVRARVCTWVARLKCNIQILRKLSVKHNNDFLIFFSSRYPHFLRYSQLPLLRTL